ncbi:cysteine sulfinic acid decarboxylase [Apis mellifera carnica]|uniref:Cysteine sulfinic acid decarboxylase n=1 Tax=Apis mellifera TaxID=7460 RepID=A0A7M7R5R6_APIME|nr:cysteine sulfinic acid decarboxylase [Apis mellifera]KAG9434168.1 cysteine sulfinic acid decarboxylase [Apis mellifera carnica]|eukprot:XP_392588.2 cysteine sulfinic acid decarboxylase [Apis mellifera]
MSDWQSIPCVERHKQFLEKITAILIDSAFESVSRENPVLRWREPNHLQNIINFNLQEQPHNQDDLLEIATKVFKYSVKTGHPYFMNQLFSGLDPYGLVGQWLTDILNSSVYTYEVAPVLTLMENTVIKKLLSMFYKDENGSTIGDGLFCPGGSFANGIAINLARYWFRKKIQNNKNISSTNLVLFTSEDAHYSILKWGNVCDIEVVLIKTDEYGRMDINDLKIKILEEQKKGNYTFSIIATAGTTVLGAFDPLIEIADICEEFNMWLHVDAAWGGGLIFSRKHSVLLRGIQRADSILFNAHKLLAVPQQCSLLLTKHKSIFTEVHSKHVPYLFQKDKFYPTDLDVGDKYLQCGRRPDVLKFWFMWQAKGTSGFEKHIDHLMKLSALFKEEVEKRDGFKLVTNPCFINVCFWFIPLTLRIQNSIYDYKKRLHEVAPKLKEKMTKRGSLMINYQSLHEKPNFFRFVIQNSGVDTQDIFYVFDELENLGESM